MLTIGVYTAERAAALSGVPKSTIHYWAREGVLAPSVSAEKVKLCEVDPFVRTTEVGG